MNILFIGPLPGPITGQSLACRVLCDELRRSHRVELVDLARARLASGFGSPAKWLQTMEMLKAVWRGKDAADVIYLTISESVAGNIKDLLIYGICRRLLPRLVVHLHGGSLKACLFDKHKALARLNRRFLSQIGAAIVLGESHRPIFAGFAAPDRVRVVPNFAEDCYFLDENRIREKHTGASAVRVLFLSNLIDGKGYDTLVDAYFASSAAVRSRINIDFAGECQSGRDRQEFLKKIEGSPALRYHGVVQEETKKRLLDSAHVLCLPTRHREGQPISILEAYAAGAAVVTSSIGGIPDIFSDGVNGLQIAPGDPFSLAAALERIVDTPLMLLPIGLRNSRIARARYRTAQYTRELLAILGEVAGGDAAVTAAPKACGVVGR